MASIVGVHGIAQHLKGPATLHSEWFPALVDGLSAAKAAIAPDLECAYYGDIFRHGTAKSIDPPYTVADLDSPFELAVLEALAGPPSEPGLESKGRTPDVVQRLILRALNRPFFARISERALVRYIKQVSIYFHDDDVRARISERISDAISDDSELIIGHSLGAVIAYEVLCANPLWRPRHLVTLGSPMGIPNIVFERLRPAPVNGRGIVPRSVRTWTNIADRRDCVALVKTLAPLFGDRIIDVEVSNHAEPHSVAPYLTAAPTGRAIARALSAADG